MHKNMLYKYTFFHKVFYYRIVSTPLLSDGFCSNLTRCYAQNKSMRDTLMLQRQSLQSYLYHSRSKEEPNAIHYKNEFYFEFKNESKIFLLIYTSGIINKMFEQLIADK